MGKVLFIACTNVGQAMIKEICVNTNITTEVVGMVNLSPTLGANKANYHTYANIAQEYTIPLHYCNNVNDIETLNWIKDKEPDLIIQTGWSQKFGNELLSIPRFGCIGEHPAPLPRGRGAACVNWAILTGELSWGDSFFQMMSQYDKGIVYAQAFFKIEEYDDVKTIYDKISFTSQFIIREHIDQWSNGHLTGFEQDNEQATYYKKRRPENGKFCFYETAKKIHDFVRAQTTPYPGAFIELNGKKLYVLKTAMTDDRSKEEIGSIICNHNDGTIGVVCVDSQVIRVVRVCPQDGTEMWAKDWVEMSNVKFLI